ncbi:MAG: hypothetical protein BWY25_02133 [Chloroflexi bacterium ADurb.Bin222]|nr:MAG: hypothetical protein BWY25_02133 [Chloroflexi bacterium ADurb.Bin222]
MEKVITAIYEKGALRPLTPLNLREHQRVRLQVLPEPVPEEETARERVERILSAAGMLQAVPESLLPMSVSEEERQALADRLGNAPGKTAAEMVIEDRGAW